ncbi:hypothetical protein [Leptospira noguchii]|nr:hypothetical protein [Leptospira noguchii]
MKDEPGEYTKAKNHYEKSGSSGIQKTISKRTLDPLDPREAG